MEFPYGELVIAPPPGFMPPELWPEYGAIAIPPTFCNRELVDNGPAYRWGIWPIYGERHTGDVEPALLTPHTGNLTYNRIVMWDRITSVPYSPAWKPGKKPRRIDGFFDFRESPDYRSGWSRVAKRHLRDWEEKFKSEYEIIAVDAQEYEAAYRRSTVMAKVGNEGLIRFMGKLQIPEVRQQIQLWGIRYKRTGALVAGLAAHYSATYNSSVHECPFTTPEGGRVRAAVALMDHWFAESERRGIALQLMTYFWFPGKPKSWRGFSEFKSHFGLRYYAYPPELIRFVRGKFF